MDNVVTIRTFRRDGVYGQMEPREAWLLMTARAWAMPVFEIADIDARVTDAAALFIASKLSTRSRPEDAADMARVAMRYWPGLVYELEDDERLRDAISHIASLPGKQC